MYNKLRHSIYSLNFDQDVTFIQPLVADINSITSLITICHYASIIFYHDSIALLLKKTMLNYIKHLDFLLLILYKSNIDPRLWIYCNNRVTYWSPSLINYLHDKEGIYSIIVTMHKHYDNQFQDILSKLSQNELKNILSTLYHDYNQISTTLLNEINKTHDFNS